jgi:2',3'-cyclic-nucleotide 2'-phosphodiesterase (5'-nucleotidase family)
MYEYRKNAGGDVDAAIISAGAIRASISAGKVTQGNVLTSFPFMNAIVDLTWTGQQLLDIFEGIVSKWSTLSQHETTTFVQVSKQIKFSWNPSKANQKKLVSFEINGKKVDVNKKYTLVSRRRCEKREGYSDLRHNIGRLGLYGHWRRLPLESPDGLCGTRVSSRSP